MSFIKRLFENATGLPMISDRARKILNDPKSRRSLLKAIDELGKHPNKPHPIDYKGQTIQVRDAQVEA